ncbi:hypothetical protein K435DRAFT_167454 [Dendrothele bispora CBS 962.96]|uniref:Uncharacterized protein n=1 Tax=Dendrothele bispora (strain CBS 962.96) TaxID=1314807 RepID=A0A4S8LXF3_DENBC|nr:hypothetical protein K435DRAFT_167454 [Dendrothele bispora CBS 962.96]
MEDRISTCKFLLKVALYCFCAELFPPTFSCSGYGQPERERGVGLYRYILGFMSFTPHSIFFYIPVLLIAVDLF